MTKQKAYSVIDVFNGISIKSSDFLTINFNIAYSSNLRKTKLILSPSTIFKMVYNNFEFLL